MAELTVSHLNDRLVAIKQSPDNPDALQHEARVLSRLDHPGVVGFLEFDDRDPPALWMRHAGTESWEHDAPKEPSTVIAALASVAATVRDLHDLGIAHGNLQPAHVIVSRDGRPILCSFAESTELTASSAAVDGDGLARLVEHLAYHLEGDLRRRLDSLAREVAAGSVDPVTLTRRLDDLGQRTDRRIRTPQPRTAAALVAAVVAVAGIAMIATGSAEQTGRPTAAPSPLPTAAVSAPADTITSRQPTTTATTEPTIAAEPTTPTLPGIEFIHDGRRMALGKEGDIAVLGDWNCDGADTPALLEVTTGRVSIFDRWPAALGSVAPSHTTTIADAIDLTVESGDSCDRLRATHPTGSTLVPLESP